MTTELNKPIEANSLRHNDERYVLVSQEMLQQKDGMDLADLVVAAWKNRFLFTISWVILAVITFAVLQTMNTSTISTEVKSGIQASQAGQAGQTGQTVQTLDAMKDQLTTLFFPIVLRDLENQLQHPISGKITTDVKKGSEYVKTSIVLGGLSSEQVDACMKSVTQKWIEYQTVEIQKSISASQEQIVLLSQEIAQSKAYADSLAAFSDPQKQAEATRLLLQIESIKQIIFDLQQTISNVKQPIVITPFAYADTGQGRGIKGAALSALLSAVLACCVVFAASIFRTAKTRLVNS